MDPSRNLLDYIDEELDGEEVELIVFHRNFIDDTVDNLYSCENAAVKEFTNEVRKIFNIKMSLTYDSDTPPFFIYTPTRIIFLDEYDGSTSLRSIVRNPYEHSELTIQYGLLIAKK